MWNMRQCCVRAMDEFMIRRIALAAIAMLPTNETIAVRQWSVSALCPITARIANLSNRVSVPSLFL